MMVFLVHKSEEETLNTIKLSVAHRESPIGFCFSPLLESQLIGNAADHSFWLQKTTPHFSKFPQRYFRGSIDNEGNECIIKGQFLFPPKVIAIYSVMIILIIAILVIRKALSYGPIDSIDIFLMVYIVYLTSSFGLGILRYRREEQYILHFLENL